MLEFKEANGKFKTKEANQWHSMPSAEAPIHYCCLQKKSLISLVETNRVIGASVGGSNEEASSGLLMVSAREAAAFSVSDVGESKMFEVAMSSPPSINCDRPARYANSG